MRTLTTSFENALKKELGTQSYIIRMEGIKKSDGSLKVFYFSNDFEEVDYTAVSGLLMDCEALKQVVDFYTGSYSFGGTDIEVMHLQDMMNDIIKDYNFRNQKCEIYYWCDGQDKRTNQDMIFNDSRLVADSNILDGATDFEIEMHINSGIISSPNSCILSSETATYGHYGVISIYSTKLGIFYDTGTTYSDESITYPFANDTDYVINIKKLSGTQIVTINGEEHILSISATLKMTFIILSELRTSGGNYFNGTIYYTKFWSGGDRNTGTLVCNLVGKDDAPLDLSGTHTFTKYVSGAGDITYTDNLQKYSKGIIDNVISNADVVKFKYANDTRLTDKMLPHFINDPDAGDAQGKVAPYVYGEHTTTKGILSSGGTNLETNNLVKALYCGVIDGKHRWILAGNGADVGVGAKYWFFDSKYKRYMLSNDTFTSGVDSQGNKYLTLPVKEGYISTVIDYIGGKLSEDTGIDSFTDPSFAADGDVSTKAVFTGDAFPRNAELTITFPETNYETLSTLLFKAKIRAASSNPDVINTVSGYGETYEIPSTSGVDGYISRTASSIPTTVTFNFDDISGFGSGFYLWVYEVQILAIYNMLEMNDLYVDCSNTKDTQREIISDIADDIGITYIDNTDVPALTIAPVFYTQKKAIEWIKEVGKQGACVPYVNANNKLTVDNVRFTDTSDYEFQVKDIEAISIEPVGISSMINDMDISYYDDNYSGGLSEITIDSNTDSIAIYGTWQKTMKADFYTTTPSALLDYHVNGTTATLFSEPRTRISFWTKNIRGVIPYDASGNLKTIAELEIGDHFTINAEMDSYIKLDGDTWANKLFKIDGYAIECGRVWIRGLYIRTLS